MQIFIAFPGRPEIRSNQQNPGAPKEQTQFYLIQARAVEVQMSNVLCSVNMLHCHVYNC